MNRERVLGKDKLAVLRKYEKYIAPDGSAILYHVETCRGEEVNCPYLITPPKPLARALRDKLEELSFNQRLFDKIEGPILPHQTFKLAVAGCPNSCSMPQIRDLGAVARSMVAVDSSKECILCRKCLKVCKENAIELKETKEVILDMGRCVHCGLCAKVCPTGSIIVERKGHQVVTGGKVGRHPRFAKELISLAKVSTAVKALEICAERILAEKGPNIYEFLADSSALAEILSELQDEE